MSEMSKMSNEHTDGRLHVVGAQLLLDGPIHYRVAGGMSPADARRLCAAWNCCNGIGTEELEKIEVKRNMRVAATEYAALTDDRDRLQSEVAELRGALQAVVSASDEYRKSLAGNIDESPCITTARALLEARK